MNLLFIYRRDIHIDDAGASRTIILRENFLAAQPDITVYSSFHHLSPIDNRIIELSVKKLTAENLNACIVTYKIDILCVPEGEILASLAWKAVQGTSCKIVTELHNQPNYTLDILRTGIKSHLLYPASFKVKLKAIIKLVLYPIWKYILNSVSYRRNRQAYFLADKFVLLSDSFFQPFQRFYKVDKIKMVAIGNPLSFPTEVSDADIQRKKNTILVVSRLEEGHKRISLILECWNKVAKANPDWNLQIVGTGIDETLYKKMVQKWKLQRVFFEGWQSPEKYYEAASIFLMTSVVEGWGMTILEAQQKGCVPIVMDTFSSLYDIINSGYNGFIVKNGDINAMANEIQTLINDKEYREQIALNAIKSIRRFSMNIIGEKWLNLYKSLL